MAKELTPLTDREKQLIEENYDLIKLVCNQLRATVNANKSVMDEMENIANYHICIFAKSYDESKGSFRAYIKKYLPLKVKEVLYKDYSCGLKGLKNVGDDKESACEIQFLRDFEKIPVKWMESSCSDGG